MKRRNNIHLLAIGPMAWVELAVLFCLAFVAPRGVFALGAELTASAEATRLLVTLARSPTVQKELKLDARQAAAVDAAVAEIDEPLWRLRDAPAQRSAADVARAAEEVRGRASCRIATRAAAACRTVALEGARRMGLEGRPARRSAGLDRSSRGADCRVAWLPHSSSPPAKAAELEKQVMAKLTDKQRLRLPEVLGPAFDFSPVRQIGVKAPEIRGIEGWVNSRPIKLAELRGKVVVLHFWTFGCINCIHNLPVYKSRVRRAAARQGRDPRYSHAGNGRRTSI